MTLFGRLFGRNGSASGAAALSDNPAITLTEYSDRFVRIEELDFFGQFARSPNGRYCLVWRDGNDEGTIGGHRYEGHGRYILLDRNKPCASGRAERPNDGKVSDNGSFVFNDWLFGDGLNGRFFASRVDGSMIVSRDFSANLLNNGLSADGRFGVCQTANAPGSVDSSILTLFDLAAGEEIANWQPESGWAQSYEFDCANRRLGLVDRGGERVNYSFDGAMIGREAWLARRIEQGDLFVIGSVLKEAANVPPADVSKQLIQGLNFAAGAGDVRNRAQALRLKGELLERLGDASAALAAYDQALLFDPQVGVARRAEKLRRSAVPAAQELPATRMSRFARFAEKLGIEHEVVQLEAAEAKQWRMAAQEPWTFVEEAALCHYKEQGWSGVAAEGGLILTLLKASSFETLPARNADTFIEALYAQNVAFDEDRFDPQRLIKAVAGATIRQLERNWAIISSTAGDSPAFYPKVHWEHVVGLFEQLGNERLAAVAQLFAGAPYDLRSGWPDLTLWRDGEVRFVEVKSPSDQLHSNQMRLISTILVPLHLQTAIAEVRAIPVQPVGRRAG